MPPIFRWDSPLPYLAPEVGLSLHLLQESDVDSIMSWVNSPECVKNLQHFDKTFTREDELNYVRKMITSKNDSVFSIFLNGNYIGQCGIHNISWENRLGRISIVIKPEHWNHGHAHEVLKALVQIGFKMGLHKIWLMHWKENEKASHLYVSLGFIPEGILKDEYFWQGKYHDMVRMAIINPNDA